MSYSVNIENYESLYLDFLEGNLNEKDSSALMAFLEQNPELIVDEDALAYLPEPAFVSLDSQLKLTLKFPDTGQKIGIKNIETFLIASVENQLSTEKVTELHQFLKDNPLYYEELSLYQRSRLQADLSIEFPEKLGLKKGGMLIPMYARFAAVAACALLVFTIYKSSEQQATGLALGEKVVKHHVPLKSNGSIENEHETVISADAPIVSENLMASNNSIVVEEIPVRGTIHEKAANLDKLKFRENKVFKTKLPVLTQSSNPSPSNLSVVNTSDSELNLAMVAMKNPIAPITNRISQLIKKEVDFKTSKAAKKKSGGFYFKIGKFELSRKIWDKKN